MTRTTKITSIRPAGFNGRGEEHQVVTVTGGAGSYRREPSSWAAAGFDATASGRRRLFIGSKNGVLGAL